MHRGISGMGVPAGFPAEGSDDMDDIHTPKESMNVESVRRTWKYVLEILRRLK